MTDLVQSQKLYRASLAQVAAEAYLHDINLALESDLVVRLLNGNNHFRPPGSQAPLPNQATGATRLTAVQIQEFLAEFQIIDHLPNQASGFSATLVRNKVTREYTLAFRSTEFRDIENGGDAERDSVRGAAGDIAFNGIALAQVSSMQKYWTSLLDGSRALGAIPDDPLSRNKENLRTTELSEFRAHVTELGGRLNVSGYSLGGHLATMFSILQGERVSALYLFNSSGVGRIRDNVSAATYRNALAKYDQFMAPGMEDAVVAEVLNWASRASLTSPTGTGVRARVGTDVVPVPLLGRIFLPRSIGLSLELTVLPRAHLLPMSAIVGPIVNLMREQARNGIPVGTDRRPIRADSAQSFLVSLFASEALEGTYAQTIGRLAGAVYPSLKTSGLIDSRVEVFQVSGRAAQGAPSTAAFTKLASATDWNIVADSGIRAASDADLMSVYIEDQPTATGWPFNDWGWGDFGTTHSITLIVDSLAVIRMFQKADSSLSQAQAESIFRAASNLRKEFYSVLPSSALAEHDTFERTVDAFGRILFGRRDIAGIDWRENLKSANGVSSYGALQFREPFHQRIGAIERGLAGGGNVRITSLDGWSDADMVAGAQAGGERGVAMRYALSELNAFVVEGGGYYGLYGREGLLARYDPAQGTGFVTDQWIDDRARFLALKTRLNSADSAYAIAAESVLYTSVASADSVYQLTAEHAKRLPPPDRASSIRDRRAIEGILASAAEIGLARKITFGADGEAAVDPSTFAGGMDVLLGGAGADRLYGEGGNDQLLGRRGADYLEGGCGDDTLLGGEGDDVLAGGPGFDTYLWVRGDGHDRIADTREADAKMHGRIVLRTGTSTLVPVQFKRDATLAGETWRSPDRTLLLTHTASWVLSFPGGTIDLGPELRSGDLGLRIEGLAQPRAPTLIHGVVEDRDVIGAPLSAAPSKRVLDGDYGHDRLFAEAVMPLEAALAISNAAPLAGQGYWLSGGPGDDQAIGTAAADIVFGGGGADTIAAGPGDDFVDADNWGLPSHPDPSRWGFRPAAFDAFHVEPSSPGFDVEGGIVLSASYREQLEHGADTVYGGGGNDHIFAGAEDDLVFGESGNDVIVGGSGSDVLLGGAGDDRMTGERHGYAERAAELVDGGRLVANPYYVPAYGNDVLDGGEGNDELTGEGGNDVLFGGDGADLLLGDLVTIPGRLHGADVLDGGAGDDLIVGHGSDDTLFGGDGEDRLFGDSDVEAAFHGSDTLDGEAGNDYLLGGGRDDRLIGGSGADTLIGDALDLAAQFHGNDVLEGGEGDDLLIGYGRSDDLLGGAGNDRLYGDDVESPGAGEADVLDGGAGNDELRGQGGGDRLQGGEGADALFGEAGDDTLAGGPGADLLDGGAGDDVYELSAGDGADRIVDALGLVTLSFIDGVAPSALRASRSSGSGGASAPLVVEYGLGDRLTIEGFVDPSRIRIQFGDGVIISGTELEQMSAAPGSALIGGAASDALAAAASGSTVLAFNGDDLLIGSDAADRLLGGYGNDYLFGLGGDDVLVGGEDADRLDGGAGGNELQGGGGDDVYVFTLGAARDTVIEHSQHGHDSVELPAGVPLDRVRLRRAGDDLVVAERDAPARLFVRDWFAPGRELDPGIEALEHDAGTLDAGAIRARVIADRTLAGTSQADVIIGDEFADILIGRAGDDLLAGLAGDDVYVIERGDGSDRIRDTGGYDVLEFGPGIDPLGIDIIARAGAGGDREIVMTLAGDGVQLTFDESRDQRIEEFRFGAIETLTYAELLARNGGLRQEGAAGDDAIDGGFAADVLYGFEGNDTLTADAGDDRLVGGLGNDALAGGAHDDTYVFNAGDGRDSILEYFGNDEYLLYRGFFTATGQRGYELDGVRFTAQSATPGPFDETFNVGLGGVVGGTDTIVFAEGIALGDIRLGVDLSSNDIVYSALVPDGNGGSMPGMTSIDQLAYVLEIGEFGDAITLRWPNRGVQNRQSTEGLAASTLERFVFGESEALTLDDLFANAGGFSDILGSARADRLTTENMLFGARLAGGAGDDVYVEPERLRLGILERPNEGFDTVVFGAGVTRASLRLVFAQGELVLNTSAGEIRVDGFDANAAHSALIDRFELADGSAIDYHEVLARGIEIAATAFNDRLHGTSLGDTISAQGGHDRVESGAGDDRLDGGPGNDELAGGPGDDVLAGGLGDDRLIGGLGADRYHYTRGSGDDVIADAGAADGVDTLELSGISEAEVSVRVQNRDVIFAIAHGAGSVTVHDAAVDSTMAIEEVLFEGGARWGPAELRARTGLSSPTTPAVSNTPPLGGSGQGNTNVTPGAGATTSQGLPLVPGSNNAGLPQGSASVPGAGSIGLNTHPGSPASNVPPVPVVPSGSSTPAAQIPAATAQAAGLAPGLLNVARIAVDPASAQPPPTTQSSSAGVAIAAVAPSNAGTNAAATQSTPANAPPLPALEALSAAGFVSPGRPAPATVATAPESASPPSAPPAEAPIDPSAVPPPQPEPPPPVQPAADAPARAAYAAYWRWMHDELDRHLARDDIDDLAAPSPTMRWPLGLGGTDSPHAIATSRAIGISDRAAIDLRRFDGLSEGIARLG